MPSDQQKPDIVSVTAKSEKYSAQAQLLKRILNAEPIRSKLEQALGISDIPKIRNVQETWNPAFRQRVHMALTMLANGRTREEVRELHGSIVLQQAEALRK